jgi:acetyl-CoA carboxylase biotin carboxyl carrier protein
VAKTLNIDELKELLELIAERNITEFELEEDGVRIKIKQAAVVTNGPADLATAALSALPALAATETAAVSASAEPTENGPSFITSPMVGTFYRQPEPGAEPFAREGDTVRSGQVLCIIEAMKLMNEIESELHGELVKILVENGQTVQYGDRLFAIRET